MRNPVSRSWVLAAGAAMALGMMITAPLKAMAGGNNGTAESDVAGVDPVVGQQL